ncbi:hypothetical protein IW261DRAFT_1389466 [Armillaria novae-zelandiae]|uniref:Tse2 ADP-ribosyltransferase toxin domain-containing protein n=1 Tax=Armillaria novae-zelandiae TaxID=153914 RepID=A0AA39UKG8_9AGAR|nr:hypothetical protein IW261DRAFT_1389466 [Armillaria novae-zelandiae]
MRNFPNEQLKERYTERDYTKQIELGRTSYDLRIQQDGLVHPGLSPRLLGPNGASVQPNGALLQELVRGFEESKSVIYRLPEGTKLLPVLFCLHEHTKHQSIQLYTVPMTLHQLNTKITKHFQKYSEEMTKSEFEEHYPFI